MHKLITVIPRDSLFETQVWLYEHECERFLLIETCMKSNMKSNKHMPTGFRVVIPVEGIPGAIEGLESAKSEAIALGWLSEIAEGHVVGTRDK